jgi:hypothetical protein
MRWPCLATIVTAAAGAVIGCSGPKPRPAVPPLVEPTGYRVETVLYEVPLALAEALYRPAHEREATLGFGLDLANVAAQLEALASGPDVLRFERAPLVLSAGARGSVPRRPPPANRPSDGVEIEVRPEFSISWAPIDLEFALRWSAPDGRSIGRTAGKTPIPEDQSILVACLSPRGAEPQLAILGSLRVIPIFDPPEDPLDPPVEVPFPAPPSSVERDLDPGDRR